MRSLVEVRAQRKTRESATKETFDFSAKEMEEMRKEDGFDTFIKPLSHMVLKRALLERRSEYTE